ncbi:MAG: metal-dependent transcriptional regulator [Chitinophagaceae bacterium]|jgi:DtxR family Mn-dependent transcriptional regulator|nr:metal-dependent transcriptional regulator [Chitinophagaceae bacterium]MBK7679108.1 metal-dependent transcriptional regulator [Chitinophagaceae bacterium]MBK8299547.1 metal-dependent transcriptional regulator [Chitinophagaceae bacterium]MBK9463597.1 metal-dependent transcriptional regulator [Chitinophagaceae bacterium]MBK9659282.1 metal-dependent transcriptional regulator [Chitinophagaceae bacterium]
MLNYSTSEENYIKAIFHLQRQDNTVTTNELANELKTKPASVTDMMKKLKIKKLLHYEPYQGFRLSIEGYKVALGIVRRHRLWEYFLAEKLKFTWDEVHEVAEDLEHVSNKKLIDKLDEFLGFPRVDPHGDPIPDAHGKIEISKKICLTDLPLNKVAVVSGVSNQSSEILELLEHKKINIGIKLEVKKRFEFDHSIEVRIGRQPAFTISKELAENIFVKYGS